ncbi:hypothetical protein SEVIR_5G463150v4 [Setaria viridis]
MGGIRGHELWSTFKNLGLVLLCNLVIIKAAIISCSTCDDGIGPYRLVDCCQPSGSTATVHFASLFFAVDSRGECVHLGHRELWWYCLPN